MNIFGYAIVNKKNLTKIREENKYLNEKNSYYTAVFAMASIERTKIVAYLTKAALVSDSKEVGRLVELSISELKGESRYGREL